MNKASIIGKILIKGDLVLASPLLIGDGEGETSENKIDIHVLKKNNIEKQKEIPFIPGTSLCGVLREYMTGIEPKTVAKLFGDAKKFQSAIQIDDIELEDGEVTSRDGVSIDGLTGTGIDGAKYDYEAIDRGASGSLRILINLRGGNVDNEKFDDKTYTLNEVQSTVDELIVRLQHGIRLGALTAKGFGLTKVKNLTADFYDFRNKADVAAWLTDKPASRQLKPSAKTISDDPADFIVDAQFKFNSSFIVRNYQVSADDKKNKISAVSLRSQKDFVIPGTSLKGIFRHRAEKIFRTLKLDVTQLEKLMGTSKDSGEKIKSRFIVAESYIAPDKVAEVAHTRNKIDRFTGGTLQGTLFTTKPVYQKNSEPTVTIHFEIRNAKDFEAGLALFLLRDMWKGNVAIGGEKSIGRGTVSGINAEIKFQGKTYKLGEGGKVVEGNADELSKLAASVKNWGDN